MKKITLSACYFVRVRNIPNTHMKNSFQVFFSIMLITMCLLDGNAVLAQSPDVRIVEDTGLKLMTNRPKPKKARRMNRRYRVVSPPIAGKPAATALELGVTLWRLRPMVATDDPTVRFLDQSDDTSGLDTPPQSLTGERVSTDTQLKEGDRLRLSIEAGQRGYLYIIDREQYTDGSLGDPYLIFPNTQTRQGNNRVEPGSVIEIPAQTDRNSFYTIRLKETGTGKVLAGDVLILLVTPQPLTEIEIPRRTLKLTTDQLAGWEKWKVSTEKLDLENGAGQSYSKIEKQVGADASRHLDQGDPLPQTVYRIAAKPGTPFWVTLPLVVKSSDSRLSAQDQ